MLWPHCWCQKLWHINMEMVCCVWVQVFVTNLKGSVKEEDQNLDWTNRFRKASQTRRTIGSGGSKDRQQQRQTWLLENPYGVKMYKKKTEIAKEAWLVNNCMNYKCWRKRRSRRIRIRRRSSKRRREEKDSSRTYSRSYSKFCKWNPAMSRFQNDITNPLTATKVTYNLIMHFLRSVKCKQFYSTNTAFRDSSHM